MTSHTTVAVGQPVTIQGTSFVIEKLDGQGAFVMLASDYAKGHDARMACGFTGAYYTKAMLRAMLRDGTLALGVLSNG